MDIDHDGGLSGDDLPTHPIDVVQGPPQTGPEGTVRIRQVRNELLSVLNERRQPRELVELDETYAKIRNLVEKTVLESESNSALITGQRGAGKTTLIRKAVEDLAQRTTDFQVIPLNGLIHTDDRSALREIAQQLDARQAGHRTGGDSGTLSAQLAGELDTDGDASDDDHVDDEGQTAGSTAFAAGGFAAATLPTASAGTRGPRRTFAETLLYLLSVLQRPDGRSATPLVIILDEFDLFTQHPKQTLLYTLFDIVQSQPLPLAVIGVTARLDAVELLEKRVKSRFSHRQIQVYPPTNYKAYVQAAQSALTVDVPRKSARTAADVAYRQAFNKTVKSHFDGSVLPQLLRRQFDLYRDLRSLYRLLIPWVALLGADSPYLQLATFQEAISEQLTDCHVEILLDLSLLELCLLIAIKQYADLQITKVNFEMVYDEYKTFMSRTGSVSGSGMKLYKKAVALKAFEHLFALELIGPLDSGAGAGADGDGGSRAGQVTAPLASASGLKEFAAVTLLIDAVQIEDAVARYPNCPPLIRQWAN
ncbi:origin recognition complex subunit 4 [Tieghemiomyces parasiticus]|uniref:Origin recognition complex subunit 4 n=1 Tax=Tieghemiomyces parasiticus TaxID=78921 RepID=A0A9W8A0T1_9FUNG|nr:origin recognition complex subunit 4 [Tieghemiomyces parasiticus]